MAGMAIEIVSMEINRFKAVQSENAVPMSKLIPFLAGVVVGAYLEQNYTVTRVVFLFN